MLNAIIQFALKQRLLIVALAIGLIGYGSWQAAQMLSLIHISEPTRLR